ncbi:hypothetical protein EJB05_46514, partial [Eragrostis curvula]
MGNNPSRILAAASRSLQPRRANSALSRAHPCASRCAVRWGAGVDSAGGGSGRGSNSWLSYSYQWNSRVEPECLSDHSMKILQFVNNTFVQSCSEVFDVIFLGPFKRLLDFKGDLILHYGVLAQHIEEPGNQEVEDYVTQDWLHWHL